MNYVEKKQGGKMYITIKMPITITHLLYIPYFQVGHV